MKNCFTYSSWRFYLRKPWAFFRNTWLNLKAAWQRATRGWSDRDTWSLDDYLLEILPEMIDHLRIHTYGYPGGEFNTPEKWDKFLKEEIIIPLQNAREEEVVIPLQNTREEEIKEWRQKELERAFKNLSSVFYDLWS